MSLTAKQKTDWKTRMTWVRRHRNLPRSRVALIAYAKVGAEFGLPDDMMCAVAGHLGPKMDYPEYLAMLRAKLIAAGLAPIKVQNITKQKDHEPRELRSCVLCEQFLDDDDPGEDVVNSEECTEHGTVCQRCRGGYGT